MDLSTNYLGLELRSPLVPSASPITEKLDNLLKLEDTGAGAVVLPSLFEEQLRTEGMALQHHLSYGAESHPEATSYAPTHPGLQVGPDEYLELIMRAKQRLEVPVIASLNGTTNGGWLRLSREIERAGADALELNVYSVPTDAERNAEQIEQHLQNIVWNVRAEIQIPLAVKLSPYFTSFSHLAHRLEGAGADGLVLFNRFYQPDVDLDELTLKPHIVLSTPEEHRLPLTWIGLLYGKVSLDFAATSGLHSHLDVLKLLMVGAKVTMMASALYWNGIHHLGDVRKRLVQWMEEHEYESVKQMQGSLSQAHGGNPEAFERAQYVKAVTTRLPILP